MSSRTSSPCGRLVPELVAVQEHADRARLGVVPVAPGHAAAVRAHPPDVRQHLAGALEELRPAEHRMREAQLDQPLA